MYNSTVHCTRHHPLATIYKTRSNYDTSTVHLTPPGCNYHDTLTVHFTPDCEEHDTSTVHLTRRGSEIHDTCIVRRTPRAASTTTDSHFTLHFGQRGLQPADPQTFERHFPLSGPRRFAQLGLPPVSYCHSLHSKATLLERGPMSIHYVQHTDFLCM